MYLKNYNYLDKIEKKAILIVSNLKIRRKRLEGKKTLNLVSVCIKKIHDCSKIKEIHNITLLLL